MPYTTRNSTFITDGGLLDIRRQYEIMRLRMEAAEQAAEKLVKLDEERNKLFQMLNEQFDILFAENEDLHATLVIRENRILELEGQVVWLAKRLEVLKKKRKGRNIIDKRLEE